MATASSGNPDLNLKREYRSVESDVEVVADTIIITGIPPGFRHCDVGVRFFSDAGGTTQATPGAGTVDVTVEHVAIRDVFEAPAGNTITAATPTVVPYTGNTLRVQLVPTGVTVATHWRAVWTGNKS